MNIRRLHFEEDDIDIDIGPAIPELNPLYHAASMAYVTPFTFAAQAGRLSEERSEEILASAYAEGVIMGSPTPGLTEYSTEDWKKWLLNNLKKFAKIRGIAEVKRNFDPDAEIENAHEETSSSPEGSVSSTDSSN